MRIGLIAPPWVPVPPVGYGGTEAVVDNLARGLSERGHDVRLFTVGESTCPVPRAFLHPYAVQPIGDAVAEAAHVLAAYRELARMDVIHDHTVLGPLLAGRHTADLPPVVVTSHGPFSAESRRIFAEIARAARVVAISRAQARQAAGVRIAAVIHHGIDLDRYQTGAGTGGYLLFLGRMCPDKGVHRAVRIARDAGVPLRIVTKIWEAPEREYYEREVRPLLEPGAPEPAEQSSQRCLELLGGARALLNPISWAEPFGLVMAEALACGTPVITTACGAAPEIVEHGRTGFVCHSDQEMTAAVARLAGIDRQACREAAERHFSRERMARDHERLYAEVIAGARGVAPPRVHPVPA
ncbi:glycosyltransferase family 4 protein [Krasilnikovia sp. MM14-A1259]|uniref:glycosyltransferase family 4 protein n=1 Tax=Krasilnikovia sp. MM14-A1259 TaxID=3373539 RepID=UPI003805E59F